jgi:hypothetical protein
MYRGGHPRREATGLEIDAYQRHVWNDWIAPWHAAHVLDAEGGQGTLFDALPVAGDNSVR